jgi:glutamate/aspartate transport system substrate-binding protein
MRKRNASLVSGHEDPVVPLFRTSAAVAFAVALMAPGIARAQGTPDTLAKIRAAKQIDVAYSTDSPPFSFAGEGKRPAGYSIDLCQRVIAHLRRVAGVPDLKTNWVAGNVAQRLEMVRSGKVQLECGNTSITLARLANVDFSVLVFIDGGALLVREGSPVRRFADLAGKTVGVESGTTTESRLLELLRERAVEAKVDRMGDTSEGIAKLGSGSIDALAGDRIELAGLAAHAADPRAYTLLPEDLSVELIAFAVPRNDATFRLEVDRALSEVYRSDDIERIFAQWLGPYGRPNGLVAALYILNAIPR